MYPLNLRAALSITRKDIRIFLKEHGTLLYLFVVPMLFILAFGGTTGITRDPKTEVIPLPVVNRDEGSAASNALIEALNQNGGIQCENYDPEQAQSQLKKGKITRLLEIPVNYGEDLQSGRPVTLLLRNDSDANPARSEAVSKVLTGVAADLSMETQLLASFRQMADMQAGDSQEQQVFTAKIIVDQVESQIARSRTQPLLGIAESWPQHLDEGEDFNSLDLYVPGFAVLFIFLTAQTTAQSIFEEKKTGSFRRLLAAPIHKITILIGKMIPNFLTGAAQIIVLFSAGIFLLPLIGLESLSLGKDPLALVLLSLALFVCSSALGVLIAAVARTEGQIGGISTVVLWAFGFAGILQVQMPSTPLFEKISLVIPHYWANTAYLNLFVRGQGLADISTNIWVLLGFATVFFAIGLWRFDFSK